MQGFLILNCIVGGQTLASVSNGHLDDTLGIVIIGVISLVVSTRPIENMNLPLNFPTSGYVLRLSSNSLVLWLHHLDIK